MSEWKMVPVGFIDFVENAPVGSGSCMCGNDMPCNASDHSGVDVWDYHLGLYLEEIKKAPAPVFDEAAERAAFEADWRISCGMSGRDLQTEFDRDDEGDYIYLSADFACKGWLACAKRKAGGDL